MRLTVWKILKYKVKYFLKEVLLLYIRLQHDRSGEYKPRSSVPRHEIEAIVHTFYPAIAAFFESEEGKREYRSGRLNRKNERKRKHLPNSRHNKALADSGHSTARKGFFYFFALKFGYSIETKNPNASPIRKVFGLFVCGRSDRIRTCGSPSMNISTGSRVQPQRLPDGHRDHDPPQLVHAPDNAG